MEWTTDGRHVDAVHLHFLETESPAGERKKEGQEMKGGSIRSQVKFETGRGEIRVALTPRTESLEINGIKSLNDGERKGKRDRKRERMCVQIVFRVPLLRVYYNTSADHRSLR